MRKTVRSAIESFLEARSNSDASPNTIKRYQEVLRALQGYLESSEPLVQHIDELDRNFILRYRNYLRTKQDGRTETPRNLANSTINGYVHLGLKVLLAFAAEEGWCKPINWKKIERLPEVEKKQDLTPEQQEQLLALPNLKWYSGLRDRCFLEIALDTGLRLGGILGIRVRHINWETGELHVPAENIKRKPNKNYPLDLELSERTMTVLEQLKRRLPYLGENALLFQAYDGYPLARRTWLDTMQKYARKLNLPPDIKLTTHSLRHTAATNLVRNGATVADVQMVLAHESSNTTQRYVAGRAATSVLRKYRKR